MEGNANGKKNNKIRLLSKYLDAGAYALEAKLELIETRKDQLNAVVHLYRALGGGWQ